MIRRVSVFFGVACLLTGCTTGKADTAVGATEALATFSCESAQISSSPLSARGYLGYFRYPGEVLVAHLFESREDLEARRLERGIVLQGLEQTFPRKELFERAYVEVTGQPTCVQRPDSESFGMSIEGAMVTVLRQASSESASYELGDRIKDSLASQTIETFLSSVKKRDTGSAVSLLGFSYDRLQRDSYYRQRIDWILFDSPTSLSKVLANEASIELFELKNEEGTLAACADARAKSAVPVQSCVLFENVDGVIRVDTAQYGLSFEPKGFHAHKSAHQNEGG